MESDRFDALTRALGSGHSRRGVLKGLTGTAIGGLLAAVGIGETSAAKPASKHTKCYGDHSSCTNGKQCCSGTCTNRTCAPAIPVDPCAGITCTATSDCYSPGTCSNGSCSAQTPKASGVACSTGTCDGAGACQAVDLCAGVTCTATNECYSPGVCNPGTGVCSAQTPKASGVACSTGTCDGAGACQAPCTLSLGTACTAASQCCPNGADVACGPIGQLNESVCCRPLGAACTNPGGFSECCATVYQAGVSGDLVYCASNGTCGGLGAMCGDSSTCAPGLTCQQSPFGGQCG